MVGHNPGQPERLEFHQRGAAVKCAQMKTLWLEARGEVGCQGLCARPTIYRTSGRTVVKPPSTAMT